MQSQTFANRYLAMRREKMQHGLQLAKRNKVCYLFLAPYAILFFTFFIHFIHRINIFMLQSFMLFKTLPTNFLFTIITIFKYFIFIT